LRSVWLRMEITSVCTARDRRMKTGNIRPRMPDQLRVRIFQAADRDAVVSLWQDTGLASRASDAEADIELKVAEQPQFFFVGEHSGEIIATLMAGYDGHRGWINYLATSSRYQRQGVGRAMVERAEAVLQTLGCPKINLQIRGANAAVRGFYESIGYVVEDRISMGKRIE
jgi:ribosomal protein S18 acetylase RimI-like enzyme